MDKKFMVYAKDADLENDISIECHDIADMDKYAAACREQGYVEVKTKAKPLVVAFYEPSGIPYEMPTCPRCKETMYRWEHCPSCEQWIEWED